VLSGTNDISTYVYYQGIIGQVLGSMYITVNIYCRILDSNAKIVNYLNFMDWENVVPHCGVKKLEGIDLTIEFRNVSFKYDKSLQFVLQNINFVMNPLEKIALVGVNGSGKSTIVKLPLRYYEPTEGSILINGIDIKEYCISNLRSVFSCMFQDHCNYAFTAKESIALSDYQLICEDKLIENALAQSGAKAFIDRYPNKTNTYLTRQYDDGEELSGGQWQKIALARAFFHKAAIYTFDEPSSALDAESEDELFGKLHELCTDKSYILISHRLSNVSKADKIIVLDDSRLIECGSHDDLMKQGGKYHHMYILQAKKYETQISTQTKP